MGRPVKPLVPTESVARYFGAELRRRREGRGWSQQDLARLVLHGVDLVRKVEAAERFPTERFVALCDEAVGAGGALIRLWPLAERERLSARAMSHQPDSGFVATASDGPILEWLLDGGRLAGAVSARPDDDEELLERLRGSDQSSGAGRTYPQLSGVLGRGFADVVARAPRVAVGFLELAGYESVDLGADGRAQEHYLRALRITAAAGDRRYGGYLVGVSLAHLALHMGDAERAERFAVAALRGTNAVATPGMRAAFHAVIARSQARRGDGSSCTVALSAADSALARTVTADEPLWMRYFGEADLADERAHCFLDLGQNAAAVREAAVAVAAVAPARVRRLAMDTALQASAMARAGDVDGACEVGSEAIGHAARTASYRSVQRVARMLAQLHPYSAVPVVRDLLEHAAIVLPAPPVLTA